MPSRDMIKMMRDECSFFIPQMNHCRQCRADAFGVIGEDRDTEIEVLNLKRGGKNFLRWLIERYA